MSYADLPPSIGKPCANFERALPPAMLVSRASERLTGWRLSHAGEVRRRRAIQRLSRTERMRRAFIRAFASRGNRCAARRGRVGRELINPRASADVHSDTRYGFKSEMARGPKGAKNRPK